MMLYRAGLRDIQHGLIDYDVSSEILKNTDILEALLTAATEARAGARNSLIKALFENAILEGNASALTFLINRGIKINEFKKLGAYNRQTALELAKEDGKEEVVKLLLQHGAK